MCFIERFYVYQTNKFWSQVKSAGSVVSLIFQARYLILLKFCFEKIFWWFDYICDLHFMLRKMGYKQNDDSGIKFLGFMSL